MKKFLCSVLLSASALTADDSILSELNSLEIIQSNQIRILKVQDEGNLYLVHGESTRAADAEPQKPFDFFITKDKKILIMGDALYANGQGKVVFNVDKHMIEGKEAFTYGSGKKTVYVFVDPQCPHCKQFERLMPSLAEKYTFKIYLFPLPFHDDAIPMSKWILKDKEGRAERLIAIANGSTEYHNLVLNEEEDKQLDAMIDAQVNLAEQSGIEGTPTVLDSDFNKINWGRL